MNLKILLVDDEPDALEFMQYNLRKEGYTVFAVDNGIAAVAVAERERPHLIVLDIMMPLLDGFQTCSQLRAIPELKDALIVFLTARNEEVIQMKGLDLGADDYITKPIKPYLFISKIKSLLRRHALLMDKPIPENSITIGDLIIDKDSFVVWLQDKAIDLPRKEFNLLVLLASKPGKVFTRDEILNKVWGTDVQVNDRTIDVHIRKIREKLGEGYIKTLKGIGYKFDA